MKPQYTRVAAYGLVKEADRILLCRISKQLPQWEGQWTLPGGGIDFGEDPSDAVVREFMEETGLAVSVQSIATIDSIHNASQATDFHGIRIIYYVNLLGGELRDELEGTTDRCQWQTKAECRFLDLVDIAQLGVRLVFDEP